MGRITSVFLGARAQCADVGLELADAVGCSAATPAPAATATATTTGSSLYNYRPINE